MNGDNVLEFKLLLDNEETNVRVELTTEKLKQLAGEVQQTVGAMKNGTTATNESSQATTRQGKEVSQLTQFYREERSEHRQRSFMFREGRDAIMMMTFSLSALLNGSDNASESQKRFSRSLMEGFMAFQATDFAIKGLAMAMGATVSGGLTLAISAVIGASIILKGILGDTTDEVKKQKEEVDKLKDSYKELSKTSLENMKVQNDSKIFELENKGGLGSRDKGTSIVQWIAGGSLSSEEKERLQTLYNERSALQNQLETLGDIDNLKKRMAENEKAYTAVSDKNLNTQFRYLREYLDVKGLDATANNARTILKEWVDSDKKQLESLDLIHDKSGKKLAEFANEKNKIQKDILSEQQLNQEENDLEGKDYVELLDIKSAKDKEYSDLLETFSGINTQTGLNEFEAKKDLLEKEIALINKRMDEDKKDTDERIKQGEEKAKAAAEEWSKEYMYEQELKKKYFAKVQYADPGYLDSQIQNMNEEVAQLRNSNLSEVEITAFKTTSMKEIEQNYYDWKWNKYKEDHQLFAGSLDAMFAGYDTFFQTITNTSMSGSERLSAIWDSIKQSFVGAIGDMLKKYLMSLLEQELFGKALQTAEIAAAVATGAAIATAYAPAAAFASIMSFGAADLAGSAGLSATVALSYLLAMPQGFETGGRLPAGKMGFFEGHGNEIVAPEEDFMTVAHQLVGSAIIDAKNYFLPASGGNDNVSQEIMKLNDNFLKYENAPTPVYVPIGDSECDKIGNKIRGGRGRIKI